MEGNAPGESVKDVHARFKEFKHAHRSSMALAQIENRPHTTQNGKSAADVLQEALHLPRPVSWWDRLFTSEKLSVAGREVKGLVIPHWAAGVLLATILGSMGAMYKSFSTEQQSQRDMLIDMKARLEERTQAQKEAEADRKREQQSNEEIAKVWRETMTQRMNGLDSKRR